MILRNKAPVTAAMLPTVATKVLAVVISHIRFGICKICATFWLKRLAFIESKSILRPNHTKKIPANEAADTLEIDNFDQKPIMPTKGANHHQAKNHPDKKVQTATKIVTNKTRFIELKSFQRIKKI